MNNDHYIKLNKMANSFFKKRLILVDKLEYESEEEVVSIPSPPTSPLPIDFTVDDDQITAKEIEQEAINASFRILGNFPIDNTMYTPNRTFIAQISFFEKGEDINKVLNSLLFSTKMAFFDTDSSTKEILKEISQDYFGYINLLRSSQNEILSEQIENISDQTEYLNSADFKQTLKFLKNTRRELITELEEYLDFATNFYINNAMSTSKSTNNKDIIEDWLNSKIRN